MFNLGPQPVYPCLVFARLDLKSYVDIARFMCLLFRLDSSEITDEPGRIQPDWVWKESDISHPSSALLKEGEEGSLGTELQRWEQLELTWGMQAPRMRLGRLLWQHLRCANENEFAQRFVLSPGRILEDSYGSTSRLVAIQSDIRKVLRAFQTAQKLSKSVGQTQAGESFFLPREEAKLVQSHLSRVCPNLLVQESDFQDFAKCMLRSLTKRTGYVEIPTHSLTRCYQGVREDNAMAVWVCDGDWRWLLKDAENPWTKPDFGWGYWGHGTYSLARAMLVDTTDGLGKFAERQSGPRPLLDAFVEQFLARLDVGSNFQVSRREVWDWLLDQGVSEVGLSQDLKQAKSSYERNRSDIARWESALGADLVAQRFELVPEDFEAGLYLDLLNYIRHGGRIVFCHLCGNVIPDGLVGSRQRLSRSQRGLPVYHPDCFRERRAALKRDGAREYARRPENKARRKAAPSAIKDGNG